MIKTIWGFISSHRWFVQSYLNFWSRFFWDRGRITAQSPIIAVSLALFPKDMRYVHGNGICNSVYPATVTLLIKETSGAALFLLHAFCLLWNIKRLEEYNEITDINYNRKYHSQFYQREILSYEKIFKFS